jgi:hypothetical protein
MRRHQILNISSSQVAVAVAVPQVVEAVVVERVAS